MTPARPLALLTISSALLLAACASGTGGWGSAPGDAERKYEAIMHGQASERVIVREGAIPNSEFGRTPEQLARQEAGQQCSRVNLEARVLDVQRQRWSGRDVRGGGMVPFERVRLTYRCERGMP